MKLLPKTMLMMLCTCAFLVVETSVYAASELLLPNEQASGSIPLAVNSTVVTNVEKQTAHYHIFSKKINMTATVGELWQANGDVLYQTNNHDVTDLAKGADGRYAVKFTKPGEAIIRVYLRKNGEVYVQDFHFTIKEQAGGTYVASKPGDNGASGASWTPGSGNNSGNPTYGNGSSASNDGSINLVNGLVSADQLFNRKLLHWNLTEEQYLQCYNQALRIVKPLVGLPKKEQIKSIAKQIMHIFNTECTYSTSAPHFLDAYGYFVNHAASCQGGACAAGMCLNILGIDYEHVNHNKWLHQWCRIRMDDGTYWICDGYYGPYAGPEPAPYTHPYWKGK